MATILVVDDEPFIREIIQVTLEKNGYTVLLAENGEKALWICNAHQGEIDILMADIKMEKMDGIQLAKHMKATRPSLRVVFISGFEERAMLAEYGSLPEGVVYLRKPFSLKTVEDTIRKVLET